MLPKACCSFMPLRRRPRIGPGAIFSSVIKSFPFTNVGVFDTSDTCSE